MELSVAIQLLADYAEALPHMPPVTGGTPEEQRIEIGFVSFEDAHEMKKAIVLAAGTLKSVQDCFGLPTDMVMVSIRSAIEGIGQLVETPGVFEQRPDQGQDAKVIALPMPTPAPEAS